MPLDQLFLPFFRRYDLDNARLHAIFVYLVYVLLEVLELIHRLARVSVKGIVATRHSG